MEPRKLPAIGTPLRRGELVILGCGDITVRAVVIHASPNGRSIVLAFEATIDGHVCRMPVLQLDDGSYRALITGTDITIDRAN